MIKDVSDRFDKLGLTPGLSFKTLKIVQQGKNTIISASHDPLAVLLGVRANQITAADFVKIAAG